MSLHGNNELYFNPYEEIDDYVYRSLNILNIDIGYNTHTEIGWSSIYNISEQNGLAIHNAVTKAYKDIYKTTPVEYLCKYIENNQELFARNDVYAFTVEASNKTFIKNDDGTYEIRFNHNEDYEEEQKAITRISKDRSYKSFSEASIVQQYVLQELSDKARREQIMTIDTGCNEFGIDSAGNLFDMSILSLYDKAKELFLLNNLASFNPNGKSDYELFEILQQIFIDVISAVYHDVYGERVVRTSNVIVYITRSKDTDDVYIHYAVIFSYHNGFLEDNSFLSYMSYVALNALSNNIFSLKQKANNESIKSAKAAIMSRNMSHNLGSHVMFYIKQKLQSVSKIVNNDVLHNIIPGSIANIDEIQKKIKDNTDVELPFLVGLGRFINYLQERQDYIATVATNYIPARSTISFKDFIYDELKPDLRHKRHHPSGDGTDAGWQPSNLLLDYIAYSEGYSKSDAIEIKFGEFDGLNSHDASAKDDFQALRKFNVAVPGGVIGRQAIFSIVENIIRNAAKHSEHRPDGKLVLQLSLIDAEKDFAAGRFEPEKFRCMRKEKGSMESGESLVKLYQNHKDAFHILRIKLDMPNKEDDIEALVGKLGEDYVEEDGSMKETSKGLKEMRISAAWLRGHSIDTAIPTTEPPVLAVYSEPYRDYKDKETISYFLCIPKPCKVAFVVEDMAKYTDLNDEIKPFGCQIFEYVEQNEKNQDNKEAVRTFRNQIADYEIVCMDLEEGKGDCILPYISSRYITNSATTKSILDELKGIAKPSKGSDQEGKNNETQYAQIKTAIDSIYEKWFEETYGDANHKLLITDDKTCEKHQTRNVKEDASQNNTANDLGVILRATGTAKKEDCENSVIYSTHFAGLYKAHCSTNDKDATKSGYELLQSGASIEAITGNNSTDRLIRQDEWNKEWKYKHLSAGLARVAIFDERIFGSFITKSQVASTIDSKKVNDIIDIHNTNNMSVEDFTDKLQSKGVGEDDAYNIFYNSDDSEVITNILSSYTSATYNSQLAQKNYERRIWAFNINIDEQKKSVNIMGYDANIGNYPDWADANESKPPIVVATLNAIGEEYHVTLSPDGKRIFPKEGNNCNSHIFDYITIHQGILDKIYGVFGIKENDAAKLEVTKAIHSCFSKHDTPDNAKDFLPRFIIHSGRSKPNEKDMPQHQPFVQFAAVDHAVKDCKHTLVELLATAHYE